MLAKELKALCHVVLVPRHRRARPGFLGFVKESLSVFWKAAVFFAAMLGQLVAAGKAHVAELADRGHGGDGLARLRQHIELWSAAVVAMPSQARRRQVLARLEGATEGVPRSSPCTI